MYAKIREAKSGARVTVCSGDTRYKHLYTTVSNSVEIQIVNGGENGDESSYFAIAFEGISCPMFCIIQIITLLRRSRRARVISTLTLMI